MATSWINSDSKVGAAWLVRDSQGIPIFHSRSAFASTYTADEAELNSLRWVVEALYDLRVKKVIIEISSSTLWEAIFTPHRLPNLAFEISRIARALHLFDFVHLELVDENINNIAVAIASSFTRDRRYQSYVANGGPRWLSSAIRSQVE